MKTRFISPAAKLSASIRACFLLHVKLQIEFTTFHCQWYWPGWCMLHLLCTQSCAPVTVCSAEVVAVKRANVRAGWQGGSVRRCGAGFRWRTTAAGQNFRTPCPCAVGVKPRKASGTSKREVSRCSIQPNVAQSRRICEWRVHFIAVLAMYCLYCTCDQLFGSMYCPVPEWNWYGRKVQRPCKSSHELSLPSTPSAPTQAANSKRLVPHGGPCVSDPQR